MWTLQLARFWECAFALGCFVGIMCLAWVSYGATVLEGCAIVGLLMTIGLLLLISGSQLLLNLSHRLSLFIEIGVEEWWEELDESSQQSHSLLFELLRECDAGDLPILEQREPKEWKVWIQLLKFFRVSKAFIDADVVGIELLEIHEGCTIICFVLGSSRSSVFQDPFILLALIEVLNLCSILINFFFRSFLEYTHKIGWVGVGLLHHELSCVVDSN